jgi:hypothetical protein
VLVRHESSCEGVVLGQRGWKGCDYTALSSL